MKSGHLRFQKQKNCFLCPLVIARQLLYMLYRDKDIHVELALVVCFASKKRVVGMKDLFKAEYDLLTCLFLLC